MKGDINHMEQEFLKLFVSHKGDVKKIAKEMNMSLRDLEELSQEPEVQEQLKLMKETTLTTNDYVLGNLKRITDVALAHKPHPASTPTEPYYEYNPTIALKSLELLGKHNRLFSDRVDATLINTNFEEYIQKVESKDEY